MHPSHTIKIVPILVHLALMYEPESKLLRALGSCTPDMRCKVPFRYEEMFGKELQAVIKSECGNKDFGTALQFLAVDPVEAECDMVDRACKGEILFDISRDLSLYLSYRVFM
jgi:hypothetical protein